MPCQWKQILHDGELLQRRLPEHHTLCEACKADPPIVPVQALAARGEPLLSSWETTPAGISDYFKPLDWQLVELLNPK